GAERFRRLPLRGGSGLGPLESGREVRPGRSAGRSAGDPEPGDVGTGPAGPALPPDSYTYEATGEGVTAYVIDTGIRFGHEEFDGRAESGFDAVDGGSADDCNGHGTHVAGTLGGETYGVA